MKLCYVRNPTVTSPIVILVWYIWFCSSCVSVCPSFILGLSQIIDSMVQARMRWFELLYRNHLQTCRDACNSSDSAVKNLMIYFSDEDFYQNIQYFCSNCIKCPNWNSPARQINQVKVSRGDISGTFLSSQVFLREQIDKKNHSSALYLRYDKFLYS